MPGSVETGTASNLARMAPEKATPVKQTGSVTEDGIYRWPVMTVGIPMETVENECRVAVSPDSIKLLKKQNFRVLIETGAGVRAGFTDEVYIREGAEIVDTDRVFGVDVILKVNPLNNTELDMLYQNQVVYSYCKEFSQEGKEIIERCAQRNICYFGMEKVPRLSRSQVFDALSSQANIAGYKAVVLAANNYGQFLGGQITAAGRTPPSKVMVIGGGVAGLAAVATAKSMGAIVRCFDTRPAVKEQVESLGGEFLEVPGFELKEGAGGYATVMSKEFIDAEMALFARQCQEIDIIITTANIPGKKAPVLITADMVASMKNGSVLVDLAAENGGNIETTKKDELYVTPNGVVSIGYTDLPSRLPTTSSRLYANNITKLFLSMTEKDEQTFKLDMGDDVTRGCVLSYNGTMLQPPPRHIGPPPGGAAKKPKVVVKPKELTPFSKTLRTSAAICFGMLSLMAIEYCDHSTQFLNMLMIFCLSGAAGYQAVWGVVPSLHTPLMAVTNAISGITAYGAILMYAKSRGSGLARNLSALGSVVSFVNVFGGFFVTYRMLEMFRRPEDPNEHNYLYVFPAIVVPAVFLADKYEFGVTTANLAYLAASLCCIGAISGLSAMKTSRLGAALGMVGVFTGLTVTFAISEATQYDMLVMLGQMFAGGIIGYLIGRAVEVSQLPQTVAGFHSLVGLAAMVTSIAHYARCSSVEEVTNGFACTLGNFIGGITLTGSIVAFAKLQGLVSSRALNLPGKDLINVVSVALFVMLSFLISEATTIRSGLLYQVFVSILALWVGFHLVASVGGGDMPVCITVLNSYSGWAIVAEGFMMKNTMMTTVGSLIGFSGAILSYIMCVAMNRSLANVLFGGYATVTQKGKSRIQKEHRETTTDVVAELCHSASDIIVVPGYGMAVAKAQHSLQDFQSLLRSKGKTVRFAIHPVAGRMPGQMNVLLAEAGVPYDIVEEMDDINDDIKNADVVLVIGANDTTNQAARDDPDCPIAGMPVIKVWEGKEVIFMKRSMAAGYADMENPVFYNDNTSMFLGDAKKNMEKLNESLRGLYGV